MPHPRLWTSLLLLVTLLLSSPAGALETGQPFPAISGKTLMGSDFELSSLKGNPVIVKIGTTWCGTCQEQAKVIGELDSFLKDHGIHYVDVFIQESEAKVSRYLSKNGRPMPETVILDNGEISRLLNIYLIPRVILLDKDLKVYRDGDSISSQDLKQKLQELLNNS
jgi:thiol-disulfide isomerase/thioredoxin